MPPWLRARTDRQPFQGEYRLLQPSGEVRWIHLKGQVVSDASGQPVRMSGTAQDITDRKAMESHLVMADHMAALGTLAGGIARSSCIGGWNSPSRGAPGWVVAGLPPSSAGP